MTGKADFNAEEWELVLSAPPSAGLIVATAQRGGTFRESFSIAKAYTEARQRHGDSELLDEIVAAKPDMDLKRYNIEVAAGGNILPAMVAYKPYAGMELIGDRDIETQPRSDPHPLAVHGRVEKRRRGACGVVQIERRAGVKCREVREEGQNRVAQCVLRRFP